LQDGFPQEAAIFAAISVIGRVHRFCHDQGAMNIPDKQDAAAAESARLAEAFQIFNRASEELATAYTHLQGQVESLTAELAVANAEADRLREEAERNRRPCSTSAIWRTRSWRKLPGSASPTRP
jgi:hypothetical protein